VFEPLYKPEEARGIWVYLEQQSGKLEGVSLELLGKARELADQARTSLTGVLLGHQVADLAQEAIACGANEVLLADDPVLAQYRTDPYTRVVAQIVAERKPDIFLLGATPDGRDLAGRLGVRLRTGLTADCTALWLKEADARRGATLLEAQVTGFGGGITADIECEYHRPQMATVRPGIFEAAEPHPARKGAVTPVAVQVPEEDLRVQVLERVTHEGVDITKAKVIIAGGRGIRGDWRLLEELASLLGGEIGATRVAVDEGWIGRDRQIGQTGLVTRPDLAICCGISGAIHFTVGVEKAGMIISINTDREAEIFEHSDYGVVDDIFQVLPALIDELRKAVQP
jgi:electron transfer flavoprotein alpha subunit